MVKKKEIEKIKEKHINMDFASLYPNFVPKLDEVLKELERKRLLEKRKEKINKINEKNN